MSLTTTTTLSGTIDATTAPAERERILHALRVIGDSLESRMQASRFDKPTYRAIEEEMNEIYDIIDGFETGELGSFTYVAGQSPATTYRAISTKA
jgi:hypothetical protein